MKMKTHIEAEPLRGSNPEPDVHVGRRRLAFFSLMSATMLVLLAGLTTVFLKGGLTVLELLMILLFALNLPWIAIGFWNAVVGFVLLRLSRRSLPQMLCLAGIAEHPRPPSRRVAVVVPVHNENPESVFRSLRTTLASLDATGRAEAFDIFLLSDSRDERLWARERALFAAWKSSDRRPSRLHYRRRGDNAGFKAGNIHDFCKRCGRAYDYMIVLDADSIMTGQAILRMVGLMESNPRLGILQTLIVGLPSASPFARIFQFGMRHGMRVYTAGSAWWQGDAGPYWGHNAIVRLAPFIEHCRLPTAPGRPPLGGAVLSHDQIEAVLMRRAGWEVRVLPIEDGSFEANPPTLLDFIKRDVRWCHGNMQYTRLLHLAGAHRLGRLQMLLAILMYTSAPCWLGFCLLGLVQLVAPALGLPSGLLLSELASLPRGDVPASLGPSLLAVVVAMTWAPKLFGLLQALTEAGERRRYGGAGKLMGGALIEFLFSALLAPVLGIARALFMAGLLFGRPRAWASQVRRDRRVSLAEAARRLWPQTLIGASVAVLLMATAPGALVWTGPILAGLLLAIPLAVVTTSPALGRLLMASGLCATPEELSPPAEIRAVCRWLPSAPMHGVPHPPCRRRPTWRWPMRVLNSIASAGPGGSREEGI
jgi:membrane glycosyltransferase